VAYLVLSVCDRLAKLELITDEATLDVVFGLDVEALELLGWGAEDAAELGPPNSD
jgi:hypothetical protein